MGLGVCVAASMLAGCGKKETLDTSAVAATFDGEDISAGLVNFFLRYQQAEFETSNAWLASYYGTSDIWSMDLTGTGTAYGDTFKDSVMTALERMLLAEKHMADYDVELTEDETAAISQAAQDFVESNDEEVLEKMSATQENVERILTLYTIQNKMETQMAADVDTEVSDEEAAQRTVSYVRFTAQTESDTEEETEAGSEAADTEGETAENTEAETPSETETEAAETENETVPAEDTTEATLTEAEGTKTEAAGDETEAAETETEVETTAAEEETETEAAEEDTEAADTESETETETETETEDPAMEAAREEARAQAEAFLEQVKGGEDFDTAAEAVVEENDNAGTSDFTFGDDDTYPDEAIIEATKGVEDNTLVDEVVQVNDSFYVLYVDDAFDEEATQQKKEDIVNERKNEAINDLYDEWTDEVEFTINEDVYGQMVFDLSLTVETEAATEAVTEAESQSEGTTESGTEVTTEAETEAETEAGTEAETEGDTEAASEAETEAETEEAAEAVTGAETETETEA